MAISVMKNILWLACCIPLIIFLITLFVKLRDTHNAICKENNAEKEKARLEQKQRELFHFVHDSRYGRDE